MTPSSRPARSTAAVRALWQLAGRHQHDLRLGITFSCLQALCMGLPVAVLAGIVDDLRTDTLTAQRAWISTAIVAASLAGQLTFAYLSNRLMWSSCYRLGAELRVRTLDHVRTLPMGFHTGRQAGDTLTAFTQDIGTLEGFLGWGLPELIGNLTLPAVVIAFLFLVDVPMALAVVVSVATSVPVYYWAQRRYSALAGPRQDLRAQMASRIIEYVQGIGVIRAFNQAGPRVEWFRRSLDDFLAINLTILRKVIPTESAFTIMLELGVSLVLLASGLWLFGGRIEAGTATIFLVLLMRVYQPLFDAAARAESLPLVAASLARLTHVLDAPVPPEAEPGITLTRFDIAFDQVSFSYQPNVQTLSDISFTVREHSMTALVGPSGSGKSTILNLVARLWDPDQGTVRIGGVDLRHLASGQLLDAVSVVFQDAYLFSGTIWDNIAFGRPSADRDAVLAAAKAARCHDFVMALPSRYDTVVGEGGHALSTGERQRVAIARAILADTPIVLLDEATAALDATTEKLIRQALATLASDKTLLVVTHRLSTIRAADQILVLENGRIVERGTHDELIRSGGLYARFWSEREQAAGWRLAPLPRAYGQAGHTRMVGE